MTRSRRTPPPAMGVDRTVGSAGTGEVDRASGRPSGSELDGTTGPDRTAEPGAAGATGERSGP